MKASNQIRYSYTRAELIVFDGEYGLLKDPYDDLIMFSKADVHMMDLPFMTPGVILLYNNWGLVETAAGHYHRWTTK